MNVNGKPYRTIWAASEDCICIIDQSRLPHEFVILDLHTPEEMGEAIRRMYLRGAGLIGVAAAWGMHLAVRRHAEDLDFSGRMAAEAAALIATRPTARNLEWAVAHMQQALAAASSPAERRTLSFQQATAIADEDADFGRRMGLHGLELLRGLSRRNPGRTLNILTHCNAGWLAFVDHGSALAPVYAAFDAGLDLHVWVDETRPRNQGAALTAWELAQHGVPHTLIPDNAGGHLMQHGMVDIVLVGSDRTTATGDVANKIGTYLKALAAADNGIPFYAVLPSSTIDWTLQDGVRDIPIEQRSAEEVTRVSGWNEDAGRLSTVRICPEGTPAANYGFDVTPARLVTGIITERGIAPATREGLRQLYPDVHAD